MSKGAALHAVFTVGDLRIILANKLEVMTLLLSGIDDDHIPFNMFCSFNPAQAAYSSLASPDPKIHGKAIRHDYLCGKRDHTLI